jgi:hypothetical protein
MEQAVNESRAGSTVRFILESIRRDSRRFNMVSLDRDIEACTALLGEERLIRGLDTIDSAAGQEIPVLADKYNGKV